MRQSSRSPRKLHRLLVPITAIPLAFTSASGAIYGTLLSFNLDAPWLLRIHTGNFGLINLQPFYSPLMGLLTLALITTGIALLRDGPRAKPTDPQ